MFEPLGSTTLCIYLLVLVRPVTLMTPLTDLTVCEGDIAQFEVKFSQENVEGTWKKNGQPVTASNRVHIVIDKLIHKLLIEDTIKDDFGTYSFVVPDHDISTSAKLNVQSRLLGYLNVTHSSKVKCLESQLFIFFCSYWHPGPSKGLKCR